MRLRVTASVWGAPQTHAGHEDKRAKRNKIQPPDSPAEKGKDVKRREAKLKPLPAEDAWRKYGCA